jgi:transposase, IS30 family
MIMRLRDQTMMQTNIARASYGIPTVLRELKRNAKRGPGEPPRHDSRPGGRAGPPAKRFKLADNPMTEEISDWLEQGWSPKLISSWLTEQFPGDKLRQVSPETIYQCLYVQTRGSLRADLWKQLSTKRAARKPRERSSGAASPMPRHSPSRSGLGVRRPCRARPLGGRSDPRRRRRLRDRHLGRAD